MPEAPIQLEIQRVRIDRRLEVVRSTIFAEVRPIEGWAAVEAGAGQPAGGPPPARGFKPFKVGAQWGGLDVSAWFAAKPGRALLVHQKTLEICFKDTESQELGRANRQHWFLVTGGTVDPACVARGDLRAARLYIPPNASINSAP